MSRLLSIGAVVLALSTTASPLLAQDWRTIGSRRQLAGEDGVKVEVQFGAGRLELEPAESGTLYRSSMRYDAELFQPIQEYRSGVLRLGIDGLKEGIKRDIREGGRLAVALTPDVPLDLDLKFGAVEAELELGGMRLRNVAIKTGASDSRVQFSKPNPIRLERLSIDVGAAELRVTGLANANVDTLSVKGGVGDLRLDFTGRWQGDTAAKIELGLGKLRLVLPRDVGVRVTKTAFLMGFDSQELTKRGNAFYSANWESARRKLTLDISGAFGSIDVEWVGPNGED